MSELVKYEAKDGIGTLTLSDPPANTYSYAMMQALDAAVLQARMDARKGHFMPPGLLGSQLATLERPNLATERCLHVSITLTPEQICATVAVAMRRFA